MTMTTFSYIMPGFSQVLFYSKLGFKQTKCAQFIVIAVEDH